MAKKLFAALMALAAIGAFAAATASANPVLTKPTGTVLATSTAIKGVNVGETKMTTPLGNITCNSAVMTGTLLTNTTASGSEGQIETAKFGGTGATAAGEPAPECTTTWTGGVSVTPTVSAAAPWCLEATENNDNIKVRGGKCTELTKPIKFTMVFTTGLIGTCVYSRSTAATGTLRTDLAAGETATATITEQEWTKSEGGSGCPSSGKLDMTFELQLNSNGEPLYASS